MRPAGGREGYKVGQSRPPIPSGFCRSDIATFLPDDSGGWRSGLEWRHASTEWGKAEAAPSRNTKQPSKPSCAIIPGRYVARERSLRKDCGRTRTKLKWNSLIRAIYLLPGRTNTIFIPIINKSKKSCSSGIYSRCICLDDLTNE